MSGQPAPRAEAERPPAAPLFDVRVAAPDLAPWLAGNTGVAGYHSFAGDAPGPHVAIVALTHGNELAGAIVLDRLLRQKIRPRRGRLTLGFNNLAAFARFDPAQPTASRFLDEDLNRVWDFTVLEGPGQSSELDRARQIRPVIDSVDVLLDLHSMLWPSDPLLLSGMTSKGRDLARAIGTPALAIADRGHVSGRRLIDYGRFAIENAAPVANLVEAGRHWEPGTVAQAEATVAALLRHFGMAELGSAMPPLATAARCAEVTMVVTAATAGFAFVRQFEGGEIVPERNTLIALDGATEIRTPHDECLMVMPSLRPSRGHTAVRLARFVN